MTPSTPKVDDWTPPRRVRLDQQTPTEAVIRAAIAAVEAGPAHPHMTKATCLLEQALNAVADFVDNVPETPKSPDIMREALQSARDALVGACGYPTKHSVIVEIDNALKVSDVAF